MANHPEKKTENVQVYLKGDLDDLAPIIKESGGKIKYSVKGYFNVLISAEKALQLSSFPEVKSIQYFPGKGEALVDQSLVNTRVNLVRQAAQPLEKNYSDKGVIMGIIDTGIDFDHPDFKDFLGNTRIIAIWDQNQSFDSTLTPSTFGYGQAWDSVAINNGTCTHSDLLSFFGHGTNVSGIAGGNGNSVPDSIANYESFAYESYFVVVAEDFSSPNFTSVVADGVDYIFQLADSLGMPAVTNASLGQYTGSHDGLDLPAQRIDSLITSSSGKVMVAAAGNSGTVAPYHLGHQVNTDTSFTWFAPNPSSAFGTSAMFFELWADTAQFNQVDFAFGVSDSSNGFKLSQTNFLQIQNRLNSVIGDSLIDTAGNYLGLLQTYAEVQGGRYLLQGLLLNPPANRYIDFITTGQGRFDIWSNSFFGYSNIVDLQNTNIAATGRFQYYKNPDNLQIIVSSWACSPNVITVGNFENRNQYQDMDSILQTFSTIPGSRVPSSSRGPNRLGVQKPNISAPGGLVLCAGLSDDLNQIKAIPSLRSFVGLGGYHRRNGGTSMASPAVAGIVALMLEKCPKLNANEIISRIENSAYSYSLTPAGLPNFEWGAGKVDGFAALLGLDFSPSIVYSQDSLICPGETVQISTQNSYDAYQWSTGDSGQSVSINTKGVYSLTVTDSLGCSATIDSIRVDSVANPIFSLGNDTSICANEILTLSADTNLNNPVWNGVAGTASFQTNSDTLVALQMQNQFGCFGSDTILVNYYAVKKPHLGNDTSICSQDSLIISISNFIAYQWNDGDSVSIKKVFNAGLYSVEVIDSNRCFSSDTLELVSIYTLPQIVLPNDTSICLGDSINSSLTSNYQYQWFDISQSPNKAFFSSGTFSVQAIDSIGCSSKDSFEIVDVFSLPQISLPNDTSICLGDSIIISLPTSFNYLWNDGLNSNSRIEKTPASFWVLATDSNHCLSTDTFSLISNFSLPNFSLGSDTSICSGDSIAIGVTFLDAKYLWDSGDTLGFISVFQKGTYKLTVTDSNKCPFKDSIFILENALPQFDLGNDTGLCSNDYFTKFLFGPSNMVSYLWPYGKIGSTVSFCNGPIGAICIYSIPPDGKVWLTVIDSSSCTYSDTIQFFDFAPPNISLGPDLSYCLNNDSFQVNLEVSNQNLTHYLWNDNSTDSINTVSNFGEFWVEVTDTNGCKGRDSVKIDALAIPVFNLGKDTLLPTSITNYQIGAGIKAQSYLWQNGSTDSSITLQIGGDYPQIIWCEATNAESCSYSDSLSIDWYLWSVEELNKEVPFVLFPNPSDGNINIKLGKNLIQSQISIFDGNGKLVFSQKISGFENDIISISNHFASGVYLIKLESNNSYSYQTFSVY